MKILKDGTIRYSWSEVTLAEFYIRKSGYMTNRPWHEETWWPEMQRLREAIGHEMMAEFMANAMGTNEGLWSCDV